jgi:hypothetical protein
MQLLNNLGREQMDRPFNGLKLDKEYVHCQALYKRVPRSDLDEEVKKSRSAMQTLEAKESLYLTSCSEKSSEGKGGFRHAEVQLDQGWALVVALLPKGYLDLMISNRGQAPLMRTQIPVPQGSSSFRVRTQALGYDIACFVNNVACETLESSNSPMDTRRSSSITRGGQK